MNRGDRLVFSNGIIVLAGAAALLLVAFGGITNALIPLYAVGVFTSFTLSQSGMVRHHLKLREPHWRRSAVLNGVGAVATLVVLLIVAITKFTSGAWVPIVVIPAIVLLFKAIKRHYTNTSPSASACRPTTARRASGTPSSCSSKTSNAGALEALAYGTSIAPDHLLAVTVVGDGDRGRTDREEVVGARDHGAARDRAARRRGEFTAATLAYIDEVAAAAGTNDIVNVLIPEFFVRALVGASAAQPEHADPQGPAAVPQEHRGHVDPVPRGVSVSADGSAEPFRYTLPSTSEWRNRQTR